MRKKKKSCSFSGVEEFSDRVGYFAVAAPRPAALSEIASDVSTLQYL